MIPDCGFYWRTFIADQGNLPTGFRQHEGVIQHARAAAEIAQHQNCDLQGNMISSTVLWYQEVLTRRLAIAGGGTAGHVTTGLAMMEAYQGAFDDVEVYFIGCAGGFENQLVPARGFVLKKVPGSPYARQGFFGKVRSVIELARGFLRARQLLRQERTRLVIGLGGYASAGAVLAARSLGIATVVHEANASFGMANKLTSRMADLICMGWEGAQAGRRGVPVVFTGNPILAEIGARVARVRDPRSARRILVTGGSEGAPFLNERVPPLLKRVADHGVTLRVRHQTGAGNSEHYCKAGIQAEVTDFIDDMAAAYAEAEFAIASAGALTLAELSAAGIPSLILPTRSVANDHQQANAAEYAERTGNIWVTENDWDEARLTARLTELLKNPEALWQQADWLRSHSDPEAAAKVIAACEKMMATRW
jgi:UDP-N-acetylglucosamine--N-acetylmuramyl-(pentapeptide) pyrophosphoryl-undecaprenol N-acetylglucosamine transferase